MYNPIANNGCETLAEEITQLSAHMNAATYKLLEMIAEFDEERGWDGWSSCAHWLNWACGWSLRAGREKVRVAKALQDCPLIAEAFRKGEVSFSKVRAMTRVATAETESYLLEMARYGTAVHIEKLVRHYRRVVRDEALGRAESQFQERSFERYYEDDNTMVIKLRLPPEKAALVIKAVDQLVDEGIKQEREEQTSGDSETPEVINDGGPAGPWEEAGTSTWSQRRADAFCHLAYTHLESLRTTRASNPYQVVIHVDQKTLSQGDAGLCELENGPELANETAQRLGCDAEVLEVTEDEFGEPLNVGRRRRTMPTALARALSIRDQGCRFPGCDHKMYVEGHHIQHWARGGETKLHNMIQLCHLHHRAVHEGQCQVQRVGPNAFEFRDREGRVIPESNPSQIGFAQRVVRLTAPETTDSTRLPRWDGTEADYGSMICNLQDATERGKGH